MHNINFDLREMHVISSIYMNRIAIPMSSILWRDYDKHLFNIYDITTPVRQLDRNIYACTTVPYTRARMLFPHSEESRMESAPVMRAIAHRELNKLIATFDKCIAGWKNVPHMWCDPREAELYRKQAMTAIKALYKVERTYSIVMFNTSQSGVKVA